MKLQDCRIAGWQKGKGKGQGQGSGLFDLCNLSDLSDLSDLSAMLPFCNPAMVK
jgi:hypothetical protein